MCSTIKKSWFSPPKPTTQPETHITTGDKILAFVDGEPMFYGSVVAEGLNMDTRTVIKWLKRLEKAGYIKRVDMDSDPSPTQAAYMKELKASGMKLNQFHNAKWYEIVEDADVLGV